MVCANPSIAPALSAELGHASGDGARGGRDSDDVGRQVY